MSSVRTCALAATARPARVQPATTRSVASLASAPLASAPNDQSSHLVYPLHATNNSKKERFGRLKNRGGTNLAHKWAPIRRTLSISRQLSVTIARRAPSS
jgi:hypothetical protein